MSTRAWLGDLVRAQHVFADEAAWREGARQIGVVVVDVGLPRPPLGPPADDELRVDGPLHPENLRDRDTQPPESSESVEGPATHAPTLLWAVVSARSVEPATPASVATEQSGDVEAHASGYVRTTQPDAPAALDVARVVNEIERQVAPRGRTGLISVGSAVARLARGAVPDRLPRVWRSRAPRKVFAWWDTSAALAPFGEDAKALLDGLERRVGRNVAVRRFEGNPFASMRDDNLEVVRSLREPRRGDAIVAVSDLGLFAGESKAWRTVGERLGRRGVALVASPPFAPGPRDVPEWCMVPWANARLPSRSQRDADARALLTRLSVTTWVERGLLRSLRLQAGLGVAAESDVWTHQDVDGSFPGALCLWRAPLVALREALVALPESEIARVVAEVQRWHAGPQPEELWVQDIITLLGLGLEVPVGEASRPEHLARRLLSDADGGLPRPVAAWIKSIEHGVPRGFASVRFRELVARAHEGEASVRVPEFVDAMGGLHPSGAVRWWHIAEHAGLCRIDAQAPPTGSPLAWIDGRTAMFEVEVAGGWRPPRAGSAVAFELPEADEAARADEVVRPEWAEAAGRDDYGVWTSVRVGLVVVRMRWIEPGSGIVGLPAGEVGGARDEAEREVTFDEGYWIAEAPTTQALWREVMGDSPSRFDGPELPVEQVSWDDIQRFLAQLAARVPGLEAVLPTEDAWEYACRAGTRTTTYAGDLGVGEEMATAVLDAIAWYSGNSAGTSHRVATKAPNTWGLYDMLGNVWEWTEGRHGGQRVLRGGGASSSARFVRAAQRFVFQPGVRNSHFGFRFARGHVHPVQAGTEVRVRAGSEARSPQSPAFVPTPTAARIALRTDRTLLTLEALPRPAWATAFGRDRFGLWADEVIAGVRLRLRWIPPGRFLVGSPEDEPGRDDDEGPRHQVLLTQGFWLAEVPCTQALWTAVMGRKNNPSEFKSPNRPVENLSWEEARAFAEDALAERGHAGYGLPTEAQWEHACRSGSAEATYGGAMHIRGKNNAPVLDALGWYGGNSGVGWALPVSQGRESIEWPDKQYPHTRAGTREVAQKTPNSWGLYDMLGNVWEWCADGKRPYTADPVEDPVGPIGMGSGRVLRGGAWSYDARYVRAAYRLALPPDDRRASIGFRLSRGQARQEPGPGLRSQHSAVTGRASGANAGGVSARAEASRSDSDTREADDQGPPSPNSPPPATDSRQTRRSAWDRFTGLLKPKKP